MCSRHYQREKFSVGQVADLAGNCHLIGLILRPALQSVFHNLISFALACFIFVESKKWLLTFFFIGKPTIDYFPKSVYTVNETNNITMVCGADGVPRPTITWKKMSSGRIVGEGEEFHIVAASKTDDGVYICFAQNELGDDSKGVTLQVQSKLVAG